MVVHSINNFNGERNAVVTFISKQPHLWLIQSSLRELFDLTFMPYSQNNKLNGYLFDKIKYRDSFICANAKKQGSFCLRKFFSE